MKKFFITESEKKSIRKMYGLNEQVNTSELPPVNFEESFPNNMVTIRNGQELNRAISELNNNITQATEEGKRLSNISIKIRSGYSPENATNRLPQGISQPDHNYGGLQGMTTEICPTGQKNLGNGRLCWIKYGDSQYESGYTRIKDGNIFLARQRSLNLKDYLNQYLQRTYGLTEQNITIEVSDQIDNQRRFVEAIIDSYVFIIKLPKIVEPYVMQYKAFKTNYVGQDQNDKGSGSYGSGDFYWYADPKKDLGKGFGKPINITKDRFDQLKSNGIQEKEYDGPLLRAGSQTGSGPLNTDRSIR